MGAFQTLIHTENSGTSDASDKSFSSFLPPQRPCRLATSQLSGRSLTNKSQKARFNKTYQLCISVLHVLIKTIFESAGDVKATPNRGKGPSLPKSKPNELLSKRLGTWVPL